ncbi:MAG: FAD-dependent oxidoreductase [Myxococcota bacterium]
MHPDVIIIGAGIVGAACADALTTEHVSVMVIDRTPATGTTAAAMGHILVVDDDPALLALTHRGRAQWEARSGALPSEAEWEPSGTLWVAHNDAEMDLARDKAQTLRSQGAEAEVIDASQLRELEPHLHPRLPGALHVPGDRTLYPPGAAMWLLQRASERGAQLSFGRSVAALEASGVVLDDGTRVTAGSVVVATGAHTALLPEPIAAAIRPRKGHLAITDRYPGLLRHHVAELGYFASTDPTRTESVAFNVQPRGTGQILIGSSRQLDRRDRAVERRIVAEMFRRATRFMPALAQIDVLRVWAGTRPATSDKRPLIGPLPDRAGVYLALGHEGLGITTALVTGELIIAAISGRPAPLDTAPFAPTRLRVHSPDGDRWRTSA